jgi:hypothetical protein
MNKGFINTHRKMLKNKILQGSFMKLGVWNHLLLNATHKTYKSKKYNFTVQRGQLLTSSRLIAEQYDDDYQKINRFLNTLVKSKMITKETVITKLGNITLITINKYDDYQPQNGIDKKPYNRVPYDKILEAWNNNEFLRSIKILNVDRKEIIKEVYNIDDGETFKQIVNKAISSEFLVSKKLTTIDWLMKEKNYMKVLEGNYDANE